MVLADPAVRHHRRVTHLGLLFWETRYVSVTLAYPGLKPRPQAQAGKQKGS